VEEIARVGGWGMGGGASWGGGVGGVVGGTGGWWGGGVLSADYGITNLYSGSLDFFTHISLIFSIKTQTESVITSPS